MLPPIELPSKRAATLVATGLAPAPLAAGLARRAAGFGIPSACDRAKSLTMNLALFEGYMELVEKRIVDDYGSASRFASSLRQRAVDLLDHSILDNKGKACFLRELRDLAGRPEVHRYLEALEQALDGATVDSPAQLFALTEAHAGNRDAAMKWLAVLIQDYTGTVDEGGMFLAEIENVGDRARLQRVLPKIEAALNEGRLAPYPPGVPVVSPTFYHYYVPVYVAQRLVDEGIPANLAFITAATFNLEYELAHVALITERHVDVLPVVEGLLAKTSGWNRARLEERVAQLRSQGKVNDEFSYADVDLDVDLGLTAEQKKRFYEAIAEHYELDAKLGQQVDALPQKTLHRIAHTSNVFSLGRMGRDRDYFDLARAAAGPLYRFYDRGLGQPTALPQSSRGDIVVGFAGAAEVLPDRALPAPLTPERLIRGLEANPARFMRSLFARVGPPEPAKGRSPSELPGLQPPAARDRAFERLAARMNARHASAPVAIIDVGFDDSTLKDAVAPRDFIGNDSDPSTRGIATRHGTPVADIATRGSAALKAMPIRGELAQLDEALDHAAKNGAWVVNISQSMFAASAADVEAFLALLNRHQDVLVVVAAGNRGERLGENPLELAAVDAPNLIKVAAATADGQRFDGSNFHERLVQFAARGGTNDARLYRDSTWSSWRNRAMKAMGFDSEATSHAAPAVANLAARVRLLAPSLTPSEAVSVLAASCDLPPGLAGYVGYGVPDPERTMTLACLIELIRVGKPLPEAASQLGITEARAHELLAPVSGAGSPRCLD